VHLFVQASVERREAAAQRPDCVFVERACAQDHDGNVERAIPILALVTSTDVCRGVQENTGEEGQEHADAGSKENAGPAIFGHAVEHSAAGIYCSKGQGGCSEETTWLLPSRLSS
jgi:hypothetical protein